MECVALGAEKRQAQLWGHREISDPKFGDAPEDTKAKRRWVDDFEETIAVFTMITIAGDDGKTYHPYCHFTFWDDGCIHKCEGAIFGLMDAHHCQALTLA